jgi:predicted metal-dependent HD superfamily phosphohydrolase
MPANRWCQLCENAGLDGRAEWAVLTAGYGEPGRAYHNLRHVLDCLRLLDEYGHLAANPVALEFAIWFHDLVYDPRAADNEERSAAAAAEFLAPTSFGPAVAALIMATMHHTAPPGGDAGLICDIDLSILGREPAAYAAYAEAIRREYAWVPPDRYAVGRTRVLRGLLERSEIFSHRDLRERFDKQARANLHWEISALTDATAKPPEPNQPEEK